MQPAQRRNEFLLNDNPHGGDLLFNMNNSQMHYAQQSKVINPARRRAITLSNALARTRKSPQFQDTKCVKRFIFLCFQPATRRPMQYAKHLLYPQGGEILKLAKNVQKYFLARSAERRETQIILISKKQIIVC